jgi:hypothetical protein
LANASFPPIRKTLSNSSRHWRSTAAANRLHWRQWPAGRPAAPSGGVIIIVKKGERERERERGRERLRERLRESPSFFLFLSFDRPTASGRKNQNQSSVLKLTIFSINCLPIHTAQVNTGMRKTCIVHILSSMWGFFGFFFTLFSCLLRSLSRPRYVKDRIKEPPFLHYNRCSGRK